MSEAICKALEGAGFRHSENAAIPDGMRVYERGRELVLVNMVAGHANDLTTRCKHHPNGTDDGLSCIQCLAHEVFTREIERAEKEQPIRFRSWAWSFRGGLLR